MATCTAQDLVQAAKCFACLGDASDAAAIYLLCAWANGGADPAQQGYLLEDTGGGQGYLLTDDGSRIRIQI